MATQHLKYIHTGIDLDTGDEYNIASLITITDDLVTYTVRTIDRTQHRTLQAPADQATFFLSVLSAIRDLCRSEPQRDPA